MSDDFLEIFHLSSIATWNQNRIYDLFLYSDFREIASKFGQMASFKYDTIPIQFFKKKKINHLHLIFGIQNFQKFQVVSGIEKTFEKSFEKRLIRRKFYVNYIVDNNNPQFPRKFVKIESMEKTIQ